MYIGENGPVPKTGLKKRAKQALDRSPTTEKIPESEIQIECDEILDKASIAFIRIPEIVYTVVFGWLGDKVPVKVKEAISAYLKGLPDLTVLCKSGRFYCVEIKTKVGRESQGQKNFKRLVGESNWYLIRSSQELVKLIQDKGIQ